jgi:hypothetical protein
VVTFAVIGFRQTCVPAFQKSKIDAERSLNPRSTLKLVNAPPANHVRYIRGGCTTLDRILLPWACNAEFLMIVDAWR